MRTPLDAVTVMLAIKMPRSVLSAIRLDFGLVVAAVVLLAMLVEGFWSSAERPDVLPAFAFGKLWREALRSQDPFQIRRDWSQSTRGQLSRQAVSLNERALVSLFRSYGAWARSSVFLI